MAKLFGEYMKELGLCSPEQVEQAVGYCSACSKFGKLIPIGQALVELGFTTSDRIGEVLEIQRRDRTINSTSHPHSIQPVRH